MLQKYDRVKVVYGHDKQTHPLWGGKYGCIVGYIEHITYNPGKTDIVVVWPMLKTMRQYTTSVSKITVIDMLASVGLAFIGKKLSVPCQVKKTFNSSTDAVWKDAFYETVANIHKKKKVNQVQPIDWNDLIKDDLADDDLVDEDF